MSGSDCALPRPTRNTLSSPDPGCARAPTWHAHGVDRPSLAERAAAAALRQKRAEARQRADEARRLRARQAAAAAAETIRQREAVEALTGTDAREQTVGNTRCWVSDGCAFRVQPERSGRTAVEILVSPVDPRSVPLDVFDFLPGGAFPSVWAVVVSGVEGIGALLRDYELVLDEACVTAHLTDAIPARLRKVYLRPETPEEKRAARA